MSASYHTYQLKEERAFRVVIRHLHPTTPPEAIKEELDALDYSVRSVMNARSIRTKEPLPLFFVELNPSTKNKNIFNLTRLLRCVIKVEEPHRRTEIPQCTRCQSYGHTRGYCNYPPKCVKCAGDHKTDDCSKTRDQPAKCVLCGGAHPANYKGCLTYTELKKKTRNRQPTIEGTIQPNQAMISENHFPTLPTTSRQQQQHQDHHINQTELPKQPAPQRDITQSYAAVVGHRQTKEQVSQAFIPPPSHSVDITLQLNGFIAKIESLINPLITLIQTLVTVLLPSSARPTP